MQSQNLLKKMISRQTVITFADFNKAYNFIDRHLLFSRLEVFKAVKNKKKQKKNYSDKD